MSGTINLTTTNNGELGVKQDNEKSKNDVYDSIPFNFNGLENGMEFLSVAAGVTAKDKRIKDVKNQVAASKENKDLFPNFPSNFYKKKIKSFYNFVF